MWTWLSKSPGLMVRQDGKETAVRAVIGRTTAQIDVAPRPHQITADEYHRMGDAGIFTEDARVELLGGVIYDMAPLGDRHVGRFNTLNEHLVLRLAGSDLRVSVRNPIRLASDGEPMPDLAVVRRGVSGVPGAADVLLVIELAESSRDYDRATKLPLYATAGIPECWLVDLLAETVECYSEPGEGRYQQPRTRRRGETITSTVVPTIAIAVDQIFG